MRRRECTFPSIAWVFTIHNITKKPVIPRPPPKEPQYSPPLTPPLKYRRYEPYRYGYAQQARMKAQRAHHQVMIQIASANSTVDESTEFADTESVATNRTSATEYTANIASLNIELDTDPEQHPAPGVWAKVRNYFGSVLHKLRRFIIPRPTQSQNSNSEYEC